MRRESHVRIWESGGVRFPSATRLSEGLCLGQQCPLVDRPVSDVLQYPTAAFFT